MNAMLTSAFRRATILVDLDNLDTLARRTGDEGTEELTWFAAWRVAEIIGPAGPVRVQRPGRLKVTLYTPVQEEQVQRISARIHDTLRAPFVVRGTDLFISASIGIALGSAAPADVLEQDAERAVRRVKANGGDATFLVRTAEQRATPTALAS